MIEVMTPTCLAESRIVLNESLQNVAIPGPLHPDATASQRFKTLIDTFWVDQPGKG